MRRPSRTASHDRREVVVEQHERGGLAGDVGAAPPIAMPMCAALSAGASLTPSPVMATTSPFALSASTSRSFCSGTTRAKTLTSADAPLQLVVAHGARASAPGDARRRPSQADLRARCSRGRRVVAGDHHDADAAPAAFLDGRRHARPHRIGEADQPDEAKANSRWSSGQRRRVRTAARATPARAGRRAAIPSTCRHHPGAVASARSAEVGDRLRRPLGGDDVRVPSAAACQTCVTASSSSDSGYSRTRSSRRAGARSERRCARRAA